MFQDGFVIPVVTFSRTQDALPALRALCAGGIHIAEICFRTDCAAACIREGRKALPEMKIGAGTVLNGAQCAEALAAGAQFVVSPGFSEEVAAMCKERNVPYLPGCATPTEIMRALAAGITTVKRAGLSAIRALSAAFPQIKFVPTGGVKEEMLSEYLACKAIAAVGGSWLVKGTPEEIEARARRAAAIAKEVRG